ncbi:MAG: Grx4 family monothiol glutaredoxin [Planctomycetota bacterium]|nr:Grx4 family monothiol glutaredoxin [Planctomycetota bacterium]
MWTKEAVKDVVTEDKIVVFAKGTKEVPRCGFSARAIQVVQSAGKPFKVVDILSDPSIRPALVAFSSWPTTPQVYLDGEFLGGSDIILELHESGELQKKIANSYGEEYKEVQDNQRVEVTDEAVKMVKEFMETDADFLRLSVQVKEGARAYSLELDSHTSAATDLKWKVKGLTVIVAKTMSELFEKLEVSWVNKDGNEGFAVKEIGNPPALPVPIDIDKADLARLMRSEIKEGKLWIVDVREDDEWKSGHGEEAVHLPLSRLEKVWKDAGFDPKDTLVFYCAAGKRSLSAANHFRHKLGYPNTRSLVGGIGNYPSNIIS